MNTAAEPRNIPGKLDFGATGVLALEDGSLFHGRGFGAIGAAVGELCFNTAMTGYQEVLTDPSYAEQIVLFTFPHIGNVGTNPEDEEHASDPARTAARGAVMRAHPTPPANWRGVDDLGPWLARRGVIALSGVDTRALTRRIRELGMPKAAIANAPDGRLDTAGLVAAARAWKGLEHAELTEGVSTKAPFDHAEGLWTPDGYLPSEAERFHVVVVDFGVKRNILRNLAAVGARATVVPASASAADILAMKPDGVVLSNGPGDPAATIKTAGPEIRAILASGVPVLGICLGHQLLALALGAQTRKMPQGHHGANHPVMDFTTGKVEIVSMNHGFTVDVATLPSGVTESHRSLFDGSNCGLQVEGRPIISVQHHPEASPGPQDSFYLFERFAGMMSAHRG
ncbi:glutamine-hydrolyzing carbamoyl-phosphate synthase small subunit [bacterium]|nr:glutamine-hydrolyzing carbamoyl-phosphate synthase small subunit [bacterium]